MSIQHASVSVGTTPTSLTAGVNDTTGNNYDTARSVVLTNAGSASVFVGGPTVTTSDYGYELKAGERLALDLLRYDEPFGVVASGTVEVLALHTGV